MLDEIVFYLANAVVAPIWLLMLFAPRAALTARLARPLVAPLIVAGLYVGALIAAIDSESFIGGNGAPGGGGPVSFFTLDGVVALFTDREVVLVGWIHYLCFDLVVGSWILRDAHRADVGHGWVAPCLVLTLMYGPSGLLAWALVRRVKTGRSPELA